MKKFIKAILLTGILLQICHCDLLLDPDGSKARKEEADKECARNLRLTLFAMQVALDCGQASTSGSVNYDSEIAGECLRLYYFMTNAEFVCTGDSADIF